MFNLDQVTLVDTNAVLEEAYINNFSITERLEK